MPRRTKEQAEQTRLHLLETALRLFAERGISRTSLKDIAAEAELTHGALYWHFKNRTDLVFALYAECRFPLDELYLDHLQSSRQDALDALEAFLNQWCQLICDDRRAARIWNVFHQGCGNEPELQAISELVQTEHRDWLEYLGRFIKQGRKQGAIADKATKKDPLPAATLAIVVGIVGSMEMLGRDNIRLKAHIKQSVNTFVGGLSQTH